MSKAKLSVPNVIGARRRKSKKEIIKNDPIHVVQPTVSEYIKTTELLDPPKRPKEYCDKKLDFMKYVSTSGLKVAIVRAIVALYEQPVRPKDPLEYMRYFLGGGTPTYLGLKADQQRILSYRKKVEELERENSALHTRIKKLEEESIKLSEKKETVDVQDKEFEPEVEISEKDSCDFDILTAGAFKW